MKQGKAHLRSLLGASGRRTFNRAQRAQRRLLRLGQSPNPGDIESLVRSVTTQCLQLLATVQVPQGDGSVIPATGQPAPIGTSPERTDRPLMRLSHLHALPAVHIPPAQHTITASTDQQVLAGVPCDGINGTGMPGKGLHALTALLIPDQ